MSIRRFAVLAALAALAVAAFVPAASGAGKNSTRIVVSLQFPAFHGKLKSPRKACLGSRKLKMYRKYKGKKKLLGRDTSKDNGKWAIPVGKNLRSGAYYATVAKRGKCKGAKSRVLRIE